MDASFLGLSHVLRPTSFGQSLCHRSTPCPHRRLIYRGFPQGHASIPIHSGSKATGEEATAQSYFLQCTQGNGGLEGRLCHTWQWLSRGLRPARPPDSVSSALFPGTLGCSATFKALSGSQLQVQSWVCATPLTSPSLDLYAIRFTEALGLTRGACLECVRRRFSVLQGALEGKSVIVQWFSNFSLSRITWRAC